MTLRLKTPWTLAALFLAAAASPLFAASTGPYSVTVLVDGVPSPEYSARGRIYLEALRGRNFSILLSNPTAERVAVALSVDGRNVIDAKRSTAGRATKWILSPGQTAEIPGWQVSGDTSRKFFFTETRSSYAKWLGDTSNVGTIEAVFYRERRPNPPPPVLRPRYEEPALPQGQGGAASDEMRADAPSPGASAEKKSRGAAQGNASAYPSPMLREKDSESYAATGIGERTRFEVQWTSFDEEAIPAGRVAMRYEFHAELLRLGVLPREDDLYARDRGRGFERDYAPDPYRHR